jgi:hypothetical protein
MYKLLIVPAAWAASSAVAGMYDQPYAIVEAGAPSEVRNEAHRERRH